MAGVGRAVMMIPPVAAVILVGAMGVVICCTELGGAKSVLVNINNNLAATTPTTHCSWSQNTAENDKHAQISLKIHLILLEI